MTCFGPILKYQPPIVSTWVFTPTCIFARRVWWDVYFYLSNFCGLLLVSSKLIFFQETNMKPCQPSFQVSVTGFFPLLSLARALFQTIKAPPPFFTLQERIIWGRCRLRPQSRCQFSGTGEGGAGWVDRGQFCFFCGLFKLDSQFPKKLNSSFCPSEQTRIE